MSTNFPTSLDTLTNPASGDPLNNPSHSAQHANVNDAIEAIEAKVGITGVGFNPASAAAAASVVLHEDTDNGTNKITVTAPSAVASDKVLTLPDASGTLALLETVYPVGSIYINAAVDTNPATLLGFGTWAAFGAGKVMVGQDTGDTNFDVLEETGGEKTHLLTSSESGVPAHSHYIGAAVAGANVGGTPFAGTTNTVSSANNTAANAASAHNNLQPYIVVKMWKRTA